MFETVSIEPQIKLEHIGRIYKMVSEIPQFIEARIDSIAVLPGGLTNSNYKVTINNVTYALRLAGDGTIEYLNRPAEKHNAQIMSDMAINAEIIYYDESSGNQVCKYVDDCLTLHPADFREQEQHIKRAAAVFHKYHTCGKEFASEFNPMKEITVYDRLLVEKNFDFYEGAEIMRQKVDEVRQALEKYPPELGPCHNDPLCENWLDDNKNFYLIDWEYAGMNDPIFDLGALCLEAELTSDQEKLLLKEYFGNELTEKHHGSLVINKFLCDALWTFWAVLQIATGKPREEYWPYGLNRFNRAYALINDGSLDEALRAYSLA